MANYPSKKQTKNPALLKNVSTKEKETLLHISCPISRNRGQLCPNEGLWFGLLLTLKRGTVSEF